MQDPINIRVKTAKLPTRSTVPMTMGVPFAQGDLQPSQSLGLRNANGGQNVSVQTRPLGYWPDGSVRWLQTRFIADLNAEDTDAGFQLIAAEPGRQRPASSIEEEQDRIRITTDSLVFAFKRNEPGWLHQIIREGKAVDLCAVSLELRDHEDHPCTASLTQAWQLTERGPICHRLECQGHWLDSSGFAFADFSCVVEIYPQAETLKVDYCLHNPHRARHPGGLWDLGDPGSIHFRKLAAVISTREPGKPWLKAHPETPAVADRGPLKLYQDSSGGENWNSRNHIDANGELTVTFRGYQLSQAGRLVKEGKRASPLAGLQTSAGPIQASVHRFWENFPSALSTDANALEIGLFPAESAKPYELQGGERKTHSFYLNFSDNSQALAWTQQPPVPVLDADVYEQSNALPWFRANAPKSPLSDLIQQGVDGPDNFFAKREIIDEYGWRNFGDLFADHESLYREEGEAPFISHYNNQYDAIYGFARQFVLSGDPRWYYLMDDLARHVADIDIYHTFEDRTEYNNGLFWHTDHYLDAHTATHRTFSRYNQTSSTPGQTGGGPAEEHCYSTGFLYHFWLTGHATSRLCGLELAHWISRQREGEQSLLGQIEMAKRRDLPQLRRCIKGGKVANRQYPFTRGTGNYLNTLLDAHLLEPDQGWLGKAERIVIATVHPDDKPEERDLLNVEVAWSYLVFLASLSRFILIKLEQNQRDAGLDYALGALRCYCLWIRDHEAPFLSDPGQLEFPNDTWTAQDIRKPALLYQAAALFPELAESFQEAAQRWLTGVVSRLERSPEGTYTRVLVILMQNYGPQDFTASQLATLFAGHLESANHKLTIPAKVGLFIVAARALRRLLRGMRYFSFKRERAWLAVRLER